MRLPIKRLDKEIDLPSYGSEQAAAIDLHAAEDMVFYKGEKHIVATGLAVAIPKGHVGLIWDRSGMAAKHGMHLLAGVIDADYRGEIKVVLANLGRRVYEVKRNDRIAQMLIQPVVHCDIQEVDELDDTARGDGGFGSTGK